MTIPTDTLSDLRSRCLQSSGLDSELSILCFSLTPIDDPDCEPETVLQLREWFTKPMFRKGSFNELPVKITLKLAVSSGILGRCVTSLNVDDKMFDFGLLLVAHTLHAAAGMSSDAVKSFIGYATRAGNVLIANDMTTHSDGLSAWLAVIFETAWGTPLVRVSQGYATIFNLWPVSLKALDAYIPKVPEKSGVVATANARMLDELKRHPERRHWKIRDWADLLDCAPSTVAETSTWKAVMKGRAEDKKRRMHRHTDEIETDE